MVKRALLLGDIEKAPYHPLNAVSGLMQDILAPDYEVTTTVDYDCMAQEPLAEYDLFISYTDCWTEDIQDSWAESLAQYVRGGGSLLVLHTGISLARNDKLLPVIGGKFTEHPPYQSLTVEAAIHEHPIIIEDMEAFTIDDEPYRYDICLSRDQQDRVTLLEYAFEEQVYAAGWAHGFGDGRVVYLMPGHDAGPFRNPVYRKLIRSAAEWLQQR